MALLSRIIEQTIELEEIPVSEEMATDAISLEGADKWSVQVSAVGSGCIATVQGSNDGVNWTQVGSLNPGDGEAEMFEGANVSYKYGRVSVENDGVDVITITNKFLVIGYT